MEETLRGREDGIDEIAYLHRCCGSHRSSAQARGTTLIVGLVVRIEDVLLVDGLLMLALGREGL